MKAIAKIKCSDVLVREIITVRQAHGLQAATHAGARGRNVPARLSLDKVAEIQKPLQFAWKDHI